MLPDFCVFEEDTVSGKHCNDQSRETIAEALFDKVGANKRCNGQSEEIEPARSLIVFHMIRGSESRVFIEHAMMLAQIAFGVMEEFAGKHLDPAANTCRLVWCNSIPITRGFPIKPHLIIRIPPGMFDPASEVLRAPGDAKAIRQSCGITVLQLVNRFAQFRSDSLICIDPEDPIPGGL